MKARPEHATLRGRLSGLWKPLARPHDRFSVRAFRPGDEEVIASMFNRTHAHLGGFVPRTAEYWRWAVLERPGVQPAGIHLAESSSGEPLGFAVLGPGVTALGLVVDSSLPARRRARVAEALVAALEQGARQRGYDMLCFSLPGSDRVLGRVLARHGYRGEHPEALQLVFVDVVAYLNDMLHHRAASLPRDLRTLLLVLSPGQYRFRPHATVLLKLDQVSVAVANPPADAADCTISTDMSTLAEMLFGRLEIREAVARKRLDIRPAPLAEAAVALLQALAIRAPWYSPPPDGR
jgi:GNAT superfamily N-acetyltransferase